MNIGLWDAWQIWMSGQSVLTANLWGISILWWGRFGKLIQFLAALSIIIEIIGPQRLRSFGNSLHSRFTIETAKKLFVETRTWQAAMRKFMSTSGEESTKALKETSQYKTADNLNILVSFIVGAIIPAAFMFRFVTENWFIIIPVSIGIWLISLVTYSVYFTIVIIAITAIAGIILDTLVIEPIAYVLEIEALEKVSKVVSAVLLLIGFHFDLLAS